MCDASYVPNALCLFHRNGWSGCVLLCGALHTTCCQRLQSCMMTMLSPQAKSLHPVCCPMLLVLQEWQDKGCKSTMLTSRAKSSHTFLPHALPRRNGRMGLPPAAVRSFAHHLLSALAELHVPMLQSRASVSRIPLPMPFVFDTGMVGQACHPLQCAALHISCCQPLQSCMTTMPWCTEM
jgi:hypothetical protein